MADNKKSKKTSNAPKKTVDAYAPTLDWFIEMKSFLACLNFLIIRIKWKCPDLKVYH